MKIGVKLGALLYLWMVCMVLPGWDNGSSHAVSQ